MKKFLFVAAFALLAWPCFAQNTNIPNTVYILFPGVPSGSCTGLMIAQNQSNADFYDCLTGTWNKVSGGGGGSGTVSGQASGVIPLGTSATVIGNQSHIDDGVTTSGVVTSTEPISAHVLLGGGTNVLTVGVDAICPAATGTAGTDTTNMQACLNALPDYGTLQIPKGNAFSINSTLNFHTHRGTLIVGLQGATAGLVSGGANPQFIWAGTDGGTLWSIQDCSGCIFKSFDNYTGPGNGAGTTGADILFDVTMSMSATVVETANHWINMGMYGTQRRTTVQLMRFGQGAAGNVENMTIDQKSVLQCSNGGTVGIAINGNAGGEPFNMVVDNNEIDYCATGTEMPSYSKVSNNGSEEVNTFVTTNGNDLITGNNTEFVHQAAIIHSAGNVVSGNRFDAITSTPMGHSVVENNDSSQFEVTSNIFADASGGFSAIGCNDGSVYASGNQIDSDMQTPTITALGQCSLGVRLGYNQSLDNVPMAFTGANTSGGECQPAGISGLSLWCYDTWDNVLLATEGTRGVRAIFDGRLTNLTTTYQETVTDFQNCYTQRVASGTFTITLVASTSQPSSGQCVYILNYGSGVITVARSGQNINAGTASLTIPAGSATAPTGALIRSDGTDYYAQLFLSSLVATTCTNQVVNAISILGAGTCHTVVGSDMASNTVTATQLASQYSKWLACDGKGLGDGLNAIPSGTYLQTTCRNITGVTVTITGVQCFSDNNGSSTMNAAGNTLGALLTGAITCSNSYAAGTQSANVALTANDYIKFTFVADGTSKQTDWVVTGTY